MWSLIRNACIALQILLLAAASVHANERSKASSGVTPTFREIPGVTVIGRRPPLLNSDYFSNERLRRSTRGYLPLKEALEVADRRAVALDFVFAVGSAVLTAEGRETADILSTAIGFANKLSSYEVSLARGQRPLQAGITRLELARSRAILFHLKHNLGVQTPLQLPPQVEQMLSRGPQPIANDTGVQTLLLVGRNNAAAEAVGDAGS